MSGFFKKLFNRITGKKDEPRLKLLRTSRRFLRLNQCLKLLSKLLRCQSSESKRRPRSLLPKSQNRQKPEPKKPAAKKPKLQKAGQSQLRRQSQKAGAQKA